MDMFNTLGEILNPHNIPQKPKDKPGLKPKTEEFSTWHCHICGCMCAGPKNASRICKSCEDGGITSDADDERYYANELREQEDNSRYEQMREFQNSQNHRYDH